MSDIGHDGGQREGKTLSRRQAIVVIAGLSGVVAVGVIGDRIARRRSDQERITARPFELVFGVDAEEVVAVLEKRGEMKLFRDTGQCNVLGEGGHPYALPTVDRYQGMEIKYDKNRDQLTLRYWGNLSGQYALDESDAIFVVTRDLRSGRLLLRSPQ